MADAGVPVAMKIQDCPCGRDYAYHRALVYELIDALRANATHFVTLDPFMLANKDVWKTLTSGRIDVVRPTEMLVLVEDVIGE